MCRNCAALVTAYSFTFDFNGNRLTRTETSTGKVQSYEWDYRNRLTAVIDRNTAGGAIVKRIDYNYDPYNRLVKRTLDADGAGPNPATTQYWAYDEGINAVLQFDGAAATNISHRYLWSDVVDELFADEQITSPSTPGNTLWGLADNLGTLRDIADFNETTLATTVTNHRTFNANGKLVAETNAAVDMLFAFTGKQLDDSTGLQHNLYRWYDANLGQWLSEDPMGFEAGDENLKRYVRNRPTNSTDSVGLEETSLLYEFPYYDDSKERWNTLTESHMLGFEQLADTSSMWLRLIVLQDGEGIELAKELAKKLGKKLLDDFKKNSDYFKENMPRWPGQFKLEKPPEWRSPMGPLPPPESNEGPKFRFKLAPIWKPRDWHNPFIPEEWGVKGGITIEY